MGGRGREAVGRVLATLALVLGALFLFVPGALAADPAPAPGPAPYGGALEAPEAGDLFTGERALEVAMLGLGAVNGLLVAGAVIFSRRGNDAYATRRALMARTSRGVPSGPRRPGVRAR
ncbi:hypothetical protein ACQPX6_24750 [Actinomycetospora sp. CA-101289]|uniref:hypothetical protein n=1 Tax=Actinomycetospora sp. CA-101289 TaxID=3239893 RepID=UPI003D96B9AF